MKAEGEIGDSILVAHGKALQGIRATQSGEQPQKPEDPYLLRDVAVILLDCGLRPEDPYTLAYLAGHSDFGTTRRYIHPNLNMAREALERARVAQSGHKNGHTPEQRADAQPAVIRAIA